MRIHIGPSFTGMVRLFNNSIPKVYARLGLEKSNTLQEALGL
jgi:hypothetical protein